MMKNPILRLSILGLILGFLMPETACYRRHVIVTETSRQTPTDDVYTQTTNLVSQPSYSDYQVFYDDLAPYGNWIDYPDYGYVWIPRVTGDFQPYATQGYWVMTEYGWTWVSDYRWGWAAFHYGRWAYEPAYGWMWMPGREWGPAWVSWRQDIDYFGWAPLGPFMNISVIVSLPYDHYRFVPRRYFTHRHVYNYCLDRRRNSTFFNHTTVINETHIVNNNTYYYGPRKDFVETAVGQKVNVNRVYDNPKPSADIVNKDQVKIYRPRIDNASTNGRNPAPKKVVSTTDLQPIPIEKRLTPSERRKNPQNTEGVKPPTPTIEPRPEVIQPRREEAQPQKPDVIKPPTPTIEPRPEVIQPRREEVQPQNTERVKPPTPTIEPRPRVTQPRREKTQKPTVTKQPAPINPPRPTVKQPRTEKQPKVKTEPKVIKPRKNNETTPKNKVIKNDTDSSTAVNRGNER